MRENIFGILAVLSIVVGGWMFIRCLFKRQFKKGFKWAAGGFVAMFICVMIGFSGDGADKPVQKPAKRAAVKEESNEQKTVTEKDKAQTEAEAKEKTKQAYLDEIKPQVDQHTKVYDDNWNNIWKPTMDAIANGSTDFYTAYNNMQAIKDNYQGGRMLSVDPVSGMTKEDKKLLNTYETKMGKAFTFRVMAVDIAQDGFNTGTLSPENVNKMQTYIQLADQSMLEAVSAIAALEVGLGIEIK